MRAYWLANPAFPHDTTLNQFFGESQFESYRVLGGYTVMELGRRGGFDPRNNGKKPKDLSEFFESAKKWLTGSEAAEEFHFL